MENSKEPHGERRLPERYADTVEKLLRVRINIHDVAGAGRLTASSGMNGLFDGRRYHDNAFCNFVKQTGRCLELCVHNKQKLCERCKKDRAPFYGSCPMGVGERIYPVFCGKRLIAVLCAGQFYENRAQAGEALARACAEHRMDVAEAEKRFFSVARPLEDDFEPLDACMLVLAELIRGSYAPEVEYSRASGEKSGSAQFIVANTLRFVQQNYARPLSLRLLAANSYCNPTYLSHLFKKTMGIGLTDYIEEMRVGAARELLDISQASVTAIAIRVGFSDPSYFSRIFRRLTGVSPSDYRRGKSKDHPDEIKR